MNFIGYPHNNMLNLKRTLIDVSLYRLTRDRINNHDCDFVLVTLLGALCFFAIEANVILF